MLRPSNNCTLLDLSVHSFPVDVLYLCIQIGSGTGNATHTATTITIPKTRFLSVSQLAGPVRSLPCSTYN